MNQGINLATRRLRDRRWMLAAVGIMVLAALIASAVHAAVFLRNANAVVELKDELAGMDYRHVKLVEQTDAARARIAAPSAQKLIRELVAIDQSGITQAVPPAHILSELARVMPDDAKTLSVELIALLPEQRVRLEVVSDSSEGAELLFEGLSQSPFVIEAEIHDERHGNDGGIYLLVGARLALPGDAQ